MIGTMAGPDYIVDIEGVNAGQDATHEAHAKRAAAAGRPWLAIQWRCCKSYSRIYRNRAGTAYEGNCPRCARKLRVAIGSGGTNNRFFEAS